MYIKKCPFCGELPLVCNGYVSQSEGNVKYEHWYISCKNPNCPAAVEVIGIDKTTAVEKWNTRYKPTRKGKTENEENTEC